MTADKPPHGVSAHHHPSRCCLQVLIVDSIMANFRADFTGRGELAERQQKLNVMLRRLKQVCTHFVGAAANSTAPGAGQHHCQLDVARAFT